MNKDVIIALDFAGADQALGFLKDFGDLRPFVKVGMELFYSAGPNLVKTLKERGHKVFLDLKLHDIPNTVKKTMKVLSALGADMINLHAGGGSEMMRAALEGLTRADGTRPLLIAVTMLTSTDEDIKRRDLLIERPMEEVVTHYALRAKECGLDGVVCSPLEAQKVHESCGQGFLAVTPGVRFGGDEGDQKRIATPSAARLLGSDYIVVGRPITAAHDPVASYLACRRDFCENPV